MANIPELLKNRAFYLVVVLILLIALPITLTLTRQPQENRPRAEAATTLLLAPDKLELASGQEGTLDVMIDPGTNLVSIVTLDIQFDPRVVQIVSIDPNLSAFPVVLERPVISRGNAKISLNIGANVTNAIQTRTRVATLRVLGLRALSGETRTGQIAIDPATTKVLSLSADDSPDENVLKSSSTADILVKGDTAPKTLVCTGTLTGGAEVPPVTASGTATVKMEVNSQKELQYTILSTGLTLSDITMSHIHGPAHSGENAGILVTLFTAATNGPFTDVYTGTSLLTDEIIAQMKDGKTYVNIHSNTNPTGEVRGQLECRDSSVTQATLVLAMPGIGGAPCANSTAPSSGGNNCQPQHPTRDVEVFLLNSQNQILASGVESVDFTNQHSYTTTIPLPAPLNSPFSVNARFNNTLTKRAPGFYIPQKDTTLLVSEITLVSGDLNQDNVLDLRDWNILLGCFGDKMCDKKMLADLNDDGVVEEADVNIMLRGFAIRPGDEGSVIPPPPTPIPTQ